VLSERLESRSGQAVSKVKDERSEWYSDVAARLTELELASDTHRFAAGASALSGATVTSLGGVIIIAGNDNG